MVESKVLVNLFLKDWPEDEYHHAMVVVCRLVLLVARRKRSAKPYSRPTSSHRYGSFAFASQI